MTNRRNTAILMCIIQIAFAAHAGLAGSQREERRLPSDTTRTLCKRYNAQLAFDADGKAVKINCPWIEKMSVLDTPTPVEIYRRVLDQAPKLSDLRYAKFPPDTDCGKFEEQINTDSRKIVCRANLGEVVLYEFMADSSGRMLRMQTSVNYKAIYRIALHKSIARGSISKFYEPYVDLNADIFLEKLKFTASPLDSVTENQGAMVMVLTAKSAAPPNNSLDRTRER
jgi:hypothetical protein